MILDYLDISQTLEYLEKETGHKYNFDNLKELNFSGKLDVFFYKTCTIYNRDRSVYTPLPVEVCGNLVSPFPYYLANGVKVIKGLFFLKDVLTDNNDNEFLHFKTKVTVEAVYKQTNMSFDDDRNYDYERGDTGYLSSAEFFDIGYLPDGSMNSSFLQNKAISSISYDELRFKKVQLDELINSPKVCTIIDEGFKNLKDENKEQKQRIEELEKEIAQIRMSTDDLKDVPHQSFKALDKVMYAMAKLTKLDNSKPYSQNKPSLNAEITTILQNDGLALEYQAVGKWLSRINDVQSPINEAMGSPKS